MTARTRFPRQARVRARTDFDRIFKHGRRVALPVLALHWAPEVPAASAEPVSDETPGTSAATTDGVPPESRASSLTGARLGLAVSRKVDPHAVGRNRIKRALREEFRACRAQLPPGDYVLVARVGAARSPGSELRGAFAALLRRAGALATPALPPPTAPGTMPAAACAARAMPPSR